ncbi:hypothetical protein A2U01_0101629, partial [Trifolium medium]|nr:hypothetical protein [Trifolium medium]
SRCRRAANSGSHVEALLGFALTGRPKYLKGTAPALQLRKDEANRMKLFDTLTPITQLFQKFTLRPDTNSTTN